MAPLGEHARAGLHGAARPLVDAAGLGVGGALAVLAAARRGKAVHPHGAVHRARLEVHGAAASPPAAELLARPGAHAAIARFSRSLGLPRPIPDLLGLSIRVLDAYGAGRHQDLLLVSSVDRPVLRHVFVPATDVQQRPYTSSLPYRAGDRTFVIGALPDPASPRPDGRDEFDRLARAAATGRLRFALAVASSGGRFEPVATLHVDGPLPHTVDALRFNPFNSGGGMEPVGALNRLRDYAYPLSQRSWALTRRAGSLQRRADAEAAAVARGDGPASRPAAAAPGTLPRPAGRTGPGA